MAAHDGRVEWYRDKFTGKTMDRPGMEKLWPIFGPGVDRIVVGGWIAWQDDEGPCQLFDEFGERKVDLVSLKDGFSFAPRSVAPCPSWRRWPNTKPKSGPSGGRRTSRSPAKGKSGAVREKGWRWKVADDQVLAIREMKAAGKKIAHISRVTGLSRPTIYRVLRGAA